jgi:acyl-coenzyme A thioesterase PaaI-like protein
VLSVDEGAAVVKIVTTREMVADDHDLVHGGFIFGAADFTAMAAVKGANIGAASQPGTILKPFQILIAELAVNI